MWTTCGASSIHSSTSPANSTCTSARRPSSSAPSTAATARWCCSSFLMPPCMTQWGVTGRTWPTTSPSPSSHRRAFCSLSASRYRELSPFAQSLFFGICQDLGWDVFCLCVASAGFGHGVLDGNKHLLPVWESGHVLCRHIHHVQQRHVPFAAVGLLVCRWEVYFWIGLMLLLKTKLSLRCLHSQSIWSRLQCLLHNNKIVMITVH